VVDDTPFMCVLSGATCPGSRRCEVSYKILIRDWFDQVGKEESGCKCCGWQCEGLGSWMAGRSTWALWMAGRYAEAAVRTSQCCPGIRGYLDAKLNSPFHADEPPPHQRLAHPVGEHEHTVSLIGCSLPRREAILDLCSTCTTVAGGHVGNRGRPHRWPRQHPARAAPRQPQHQPRLLLAHARPGRGGGGAIRVGLSLQQPWGIGE
jgi:hypothetical protein